VSHPEPKLLYERVLQLDVVSISVILESGDAKQVADALYSATRYQSDWRWLQNECIRRLTDPEVLVRWAAAICLGDLAWFRRFPVDRDLIISALEAASLDPEIADPATDSLSLVREFA
jgi:hypothetical protein